MTPEVVDEAEERETRPVHPRLADFVHRASLRRLLAELHAANEEEANFLRQDNGRLTSLKPDELRPYFSLTYRTAPEVVTAEAPPGVAVPQTVPVPAGEFRMGTSDAEVEWLVENADWAKEWHEKGRFDAERPERTLYVPAFEIGRYPVINAEYRAFVRDTDHGPPRHWEGDTYPEGLGDHPVANVTWHDAMAYCAWLREKTGRHYRLPTEAEWEKAAGWDPEAEARRRYPWGDTFDPERCNSREGGPGGTTPVGQYSPDGDSPYGAVDMAGNVWEWTLSTAIR